MASARRRPGRARRLLVLALIVVTCAASTVAVIGAWSRRNVLDTERFVDRLGPTIEAPEVQQALAGFVTDQVMTLVDPAALFEEALEDRPRAQLLAVPLAGALEGFVRDKVEEVVATDGFADLWNRVIERVHRAAVLILEDESDVIITEGGTVSLDLVPVVRAVLSRIAEAAPDVLGGGSALQERLDETEPGEGIALIEDALGVELDDDFGQVVLSDGGKLETIQRAISTFERLVWVAAAVALLAGIGAMVLTRSRRRTGLQLTLGLAVAAVVLRRATFRLQDEIAAATDSAPAVGAAGVVVDSFLEPLQEFSAWVLAVLAIIVAVLAFTGPYPWAVRVREAGIGDWLMERRQPVAVAVGALGVLVLWFVDLNWFGMLLVLALTGAGLFALLSQPEELPGSGPDDAVAVPGA